MNVRKPTRFATPKEELDHQRRMQARYRQLLRQCTERINYLLTQNHLPEAAKERHD
jgi:hypothetical protein